MSLSTFQPNYTASVFRTSTDTTDSDGYGAPVDDTTAVPNMAGVPVLMRAKNIRVWDPTTNRFLFITSYTCRFRPGADVAPYDRIQRSDGQWFSVQDVQDENRSAAGGATDVVVTCSAHN